MKAILLLAAVGFVLAVGFSVPFREDDLEARDNKLKDTADELVDDLEPEDLERYGGDGERGIPQHLFKNNLSQSMLIG